MSLSDVQCGLRTYAAEDFGSQVLVKLADDDSHIIVLETEETLRLKPEPETQLL